MLVLIKLSKNIDEFKLFNKRNIRDNNHISNKFERIYNIKEKLDDAKT